MAKKEAAMLNRHLEVRKLKGTNRPASLFAYDTSVDRGGRGEEETRASVLVKAAWLRFNHYCIMPLTWRTMDTPCPRTVRGTQQGKEKGTLHGEKTEFISARLSGDGGISCRRRILRRTRILQISCSTGK